MKYGSVCSGVEAATVAWHDLGFEPQWFSEVDAFPSAVLQHHYPTIPNHGDMTKFKEWNTDEQTIDLLVGGTPCQSFSVAGLRQGLEDPRGNLMLTYLAMADRFKPKWLVWENVPGVLSSNGGRDFGTFLGALGKIGYGFSWRILDAQYFGVPQRRRRVFVVGCLGDWRSAASVLFEPESFGVSAAKGTEEVAPCLTASSGRRYNDSDIIISEGGRPRWSTSIETERLQGFPDDYTQISWRGKEPEDCPNGHRYKAMGNSMAVPVMKWIGERIQQVEKETKDVTRG